MMVMLAVVVLLHMLMIVIYRIKIILVMICCMFMAMKYHLFWMHMTIPISLQVNRLSDSIIDRMCNSRSYTQPQN
ncbi:MAG: hypothetical protein CBD74_07795 [Saprospirales bacterium TMED214]|nr:MAG: hypothetical protein CBD74_07795 [Saprospirales bacterium TMED214]